MPRWNRAWFIPALAGFACGALAQPGAAPLPKAMSGRWVAVVPGGRTFTDNWSVVLDTPGEIGPISGRLTLRGVACGATDEPLTGTWNGTELKFESRVYPNVNAIRMNGSCGTGRVTFSLTRKAGQTSFEGEAMRDGTPTPTQVTLFP